MTIRIGHAGRGVYTATLDNPSRRNALDTSMFDTLIHTLTTVSDDPEARVLILRGAGNAFCSGRDVGELASRTNHAAQALEPVLRLERAFRDCAIPTVAMVEGKAAGLGVSLVCWSDIAVATHDATFSIPEARAGITPSVTAISLLETVGRRRAAELCLTGRAVDADTAAAIGLVQYVCPRDAAEDVLSSVVDSVLKGGPCALKLAKKLFREASKKESEDLIAAAASIAEESFRNTEVAEGIRAFKEKRLPRWLTEG